MFQPPGMGIDPNKFVSQMILQALQAFYNQDYETGVHFINQIRANLPRFMYKLNPSLRTLCKDIVKLVQGGSLVRQHALGEEQTEPQVSVESGTTMPPPDLTKPGENVPTDFITELSSAVKSQQEKKKKKVVEELKGSISDLEDFDF
ncbi:MAG: hypothetical protein K9W45_09595 [Candidatus Heimdallarchaeum aukensis]|uniref:Uncharacterized protein n=1 Tax=Candidatus Heimdallarchaeum aukensis TaxID=2876573 RepID=A0A9Y1BJN3_9ARCH|nr:MAG: hypothetical protein K9W45_09595 [Candidatus Heimdallarchaeum aukensis]